MLSVMILTCRGPTTTPVVQSCLSRLAHRAAAGPAHLAWAKFARVRDEAQQIRQDQAWRPLTRSCPPNSFVRSDFLGRVRRGGAEASGDRGFAVGAESRRGGKGW